MIYINHINYINHISYIIHMIYVFRYFMNYLKITGNHLKLLELL